MAQPKCALCGSTNFTSTRGPTVAGYAVELVHCDKCGAVVGVVPATAIRQAQTKS